jgi:hypothetical protein
MPSRESRCPPSTPKSSTLGKMSNSIQRLFLSLRPSVTTSLEKELIDRIGQVARGAGGWMRSGGWMQSDDMQRLALENHVRLVETTDHFFKGGLNRLSWTVLSDVPGSLTASRSAAWSPVPHIPEPRHPASQAAG